MITTKYFKISSSTYVRHCFSAWAEKWWWTLALPIAVLLILGLKDARYFIIAFALILIVYPGILALLYFNYALRPSAAYALLSRKMIFSDDGVDIEYAPCDEHPLPPNSHIPIEAISKVEDDGGSINIILSSSKYDVIIVPSNAFAEGEFSKALKIIDSQLKHTPTQ